MAFNISYIFQAVDKFSPIAKEISEQMEHIEKQAEKVGRGFQGMSEKLTGLGKSMSLAVTAPILAIGGLAVHAAAAQEKVNMQMQNIIGDIGKAHKLAESLDQIKMTSPVNVEGVDDAALRLLVMGTSVDKVSGIIKNFAEISAGSGESIENLVNSFAMAQSGPQGMSRAIMTLSRRLPVIQEMQAIFKEKFHMNIDTKQLQKLVSEGKVDISVLQEAFARMTEKGGKFFGANAKQSLTLSGAMQLLHNSSEKFMEDLGGIISKSLNLGGVVKGLSDKMQAFTDFFNEMAQKDPALTKTIVILVGAVAAIGPALIAMGTALNALAGIGRAIVLLSSPMGLMIAAIAGIVAGLVFLYNKSETVRSILNGIGETLLFLIQHFPLLTVGVLTTATALFALGKGSLFIQGSIMLARGAALAFSMLMQGLPGILALARGAMLALNVAFAANPFGVAVTAAVALVTAIGYVLNKFGLLDGIVTAIKSKIDALASAVKSLFASFDIGAKIGNIKASLSSGVSNIENKISNFFRPNVEAAPLNAPSINQPAMASQLINTQNKSTVDINLKGNTDVVGNIQSKSTANTNLNVGKNMAFAR